MIEHGVEEPDGTSSPLAFVMGMAIEQYFFVPLTFVLASAVDVFVSSRRRLESTGPRAEGPRA